MDSYETQVAKFKKRIGVLGLTLLALLVIIVGLWLQIANNNRHTDETYAYMTQQFATVTREVQQIQEMKGTTDSVNTQTARLHATLTQLNHNIEEMQSTTPAP